MELGKSTLVRIIIIVVSFAILLGVTAKVRDTILKTSSDATCRASIIKTWSLNSFVLTNPAGTLKTKIITPRLAGCKTKYATIGSKGIVKDKQTVYDFSGYTSKDCSKRENYTLKFIADTMANCRSLFHGDFDFEKIYKYVYGSKGGICYVCTQIYVPSLPCGNISYTKLEDYLKNHLITVQNGESLESYYDYLYGDYEKELKSMKLNLNFFNVGNPALLFIPVPQTYAVQADKLKAYHKEVAMIKAGVPIDGIMNKDDEIKSGHTYYVLFQVIGEPMSNEPIPTIMIVDIDNAFINCNKMFS